MENAKIENLLNLAMDATKEEREKSLNLDVGYDASEQTWEVIVRYTGNALEQIKNLAAAAGEAGRKVKIEELDHAYAILVLPRLLIKDVAELDGIIYMEIPKRLFFAVNEAKRASCITAVQQGADRETRQSVFPEGSSRNLSGKGVLIGLADSGIDYAHRAFRNADGTTRILALWDQTLHAEQLEASKTEVNESVTYQPPQGFEKGVLFTEETINLALAQKSELLRQKIVPSRDTSGHGTHVAGIAAAGNEAGQYRGVAYQAELIVVKLGNPAENSFPRTTELMEAVDFCVREAERRGKPIAVNLSFGNGYGAHSGSSLIETFLNDMADHHLCSIVTGTGNDGGGRLHTGNRIKSNEIQEIETAVSVYESHLNIQIWKRYQDEIGVELIMPNGKTTGRLLGRGTFRISMENLELLIFYGEPVPYQIYQEIYIDFIPKGAYIPSGVWKIRLTAGKIADGTYDIWLPSGGVLNEGTGFLYPSEERTLTIPSTAAKVISTAAYDSYTDSAAAFSGRGYTAWTNQVKPDITAPGVDIISASVGGGYVSRSGTSMAAPFVTGSAALLMEWGIVNGNDVFLYGEKLKAYLIRGARRLSAFREYPNRQAGWGALCVADSLPE